VRARAASTPGSPTAARRSSAGPSPKKKKRPLVNKEVAESPFAVGACVPWSLAPDARTGAITLWTFEGVSASLAEAADATAALKLLARPLLAGAAAVKEAARGNVAAMERLARQRLVVEEVAVRDIEFECHQRAAATAVLLE
jgi:hypothetical protein